MTRRFASHTQIPSFEQCNQCAPHDADERRESGSKTPFTRTRKAARDVRFSSVRIFCNERAWATVRPDRAKRARTEYTH